MSEKLNYEEFIVRAIKNLRDEKWSRGIHVVYSGFNAAFRDYFAQDPIPVVNELVAQGKIEIRPARGGKMLYLKGEAPEIRRSSKDTIERILKDPLEHNDDKFEKQVEDLIEGIPFSNRNNLDRPIE